MQIDQVKSESKCKWPGILERLGINAGDGKHTKCPICGGTDRFRFDDKHEGMWICNQCGAGDGFLLVQKVLGINFVESCKEVSKIVGTVNASAILPENKTSPEALRKLIKTSAPIREGDYVTKYLKKRGLKTFPSTLRQCCECWETETKKNQIAMLAVFSAPDGRNLTIHRTYLEAFGQKLGIEKPKKIMPPLSKMTGGAVRLFPVGEKLGVCEGVETAIALFELMSIPVWPALSATLLESFIPPNEVQSLYVFADNDLNFTGQKAAYKLANRISTTSRIKVTVEVPLTPGADFLDILNQ